MVDNYFVLTSRVAGPGPVRLGGTVRVWEREARAATIDCCISPHTWTVRQVRPGLQCGSYLLQVLDPVLEPGVLAAQPVAALTHCHAVTTVQPS